MCGADMTDSDLGVFFLSLSLRSFYFAMYTLGLGIGTYTLFFLIFMGWDWDWDMKVDGWMMIASYLYYVISLAY